MWTGRAAKERNRGLWECLREDIRQLQRDYQILLGYFSAHVEGWDGSTEVIGAPAFINAAMSPMLHEHLTRMCLDEDGRHSVASDHNRLVLEFGGHIPHQRHVGTQKKLLTEPEIDRIKEQLEARPAKEHGEVVERVRNVAEKGRGKIEPTTGQPVLKRRQEVPCDAWEYESGYADETALIHWNMVCQRSWYQPTYRGAFVAGSLISVPCLGFASNFVGRRPLLRFALAVLLSSGVVTTEASTLEFFLFWRAVTSAAASALEVISFVVLFESTPPGPREAFCALAICYPTVLAPVYVALAAQATRNWRYLHVALLLPALLLVLPVAVTGESPHWLMTHGFTKRAREVAVWAAELNNEDVDVVKGRMDRLEKIIHSPEFQPPAASFYLSRGMLSHLLVVCGSWWLLFVAYYHGSLDLFAPSIPAVKWIILSGNVPAMTFAYYAAKHHGRVRPLEGSLLVAALLVGCEAAFQFLGQPLPPELAFLWRVLLLNVAYVLLCVHTVAAFPTKVRIVVFCLAYLSGRVGSLSSELVRLFENQLRGNLRALPLGMVAIGLGIFALLLGTLSETDLYRLLEKPSRTSEKQRGPAAYRRVIEGCFRSVRVSRMRTS
ncbi:hypothetical protein HPB48_019435 [Haemaphysalis longicornis]|uniref:Uncharacterized protein n=1 Tax=Haemaphysalis longicornis TaxID=44386 RepID=A0A9J6FR69_HAELO|nr:hypothetical protein HPB48_019435 [Haemaphysalis longicornis]